MELVTESAKIELPAIAAKTKTGKNSDIPKTSSEPSPRKMSLQKTKKELMPELESEEEEDKSSEETRSSGGDSESEEEGKPAIPLLKKKKRMDTRASDRKRHISTFKTPTSHNKPVKTPRKG